MKRNINYTLLVRNMVGIRWIFLTTNPNLTLGLLRGLDERPLDAPLTERDLKDKSPGKDYTKEDLVCS